jgi:hypothetical protein
MATTKTVLKFLEDLKNKGCTIAHDPDAGTATAHDGTVCVYRALQKGKRQPWIVRTSNGPNVQWH